MTDRFVDRQYLTGVQYASDANLASRQAIYGFQNPPVHNPAWTLELGRLGPTDRLAQPVLREVEQRTRVAIERDGAFRIRTDVGCFVCR